MFDSNEFKEHLCNKLLPFWENLEDTDNGGFYGFMGLDLVTNKKAIKGAILNSRITWFFSNSYMLLKDEKLLSYARHGYEFMRDYCIDKVNGGIYWSVNYDGSVFDDTKHTYNQAFAIYALSSYYSASHDEEALNLALNMYDLIEDKCSDSVGYLEALTIDFKIADNDKLSENGVSADRTMNTLLHVLEGYTELFKVSGDMRVRKSLIKILDTVATKVYNPVLKRQEVFFDNSYRSLIDLYSYGHDIETSWLIDRTLEIINNPNVTNKLAPITSILANNVLEIAYDGNSMANECDRGVVNEQRIWWVQAEAVVGFMNAYTKDTSRKDYLEASENIWEFIKKYVCDSRSNSEWFYYVDKQGRPCSDKPIVEEWKCPYHNGRMCIEMIRRLEELRK